MNQNVLIVDDSLTVRMDLAEAFELAGFRVVPCATVTDARSALQQGAYDVIILDVLLPDGDGVELLREMRASPSISEAVILMLSTEDEVRDRIRGLKTGADEYVGKPYDRGNLVGRARELLRIRGARTIPHRASVLVIDDSFTFREKLREALDAAGYEVFSAASGEEGLRVAASQLPGAIIVDGVMPSMDGTTVIRHVRLDAALRNVPCVLLTASEERSAELGALDAGADAFVRKGEDIDVVLARVAAIFRRAPRAALPDSTASLQSPKRILTVDDSETYLQEIAATLREEGYDVVLARSGEEALDLLAVQQVDCILLDLQMPGLGGHETCRRIKAAPIVRDVPVIMLTALEDRSSMIEGLGAGADDYIPKSSEFQVLQARVRAQIRRKQFEDENRNIREELLRREIEARAARELAETRAALVHELEQKNGELEAFSYTVSHDLRAPLRHIGAFSQMLVEDFGENVTPQANQYISSIRNSVSRMSELIDDLLTLSRIGLAGMEVRDIDLTAMAHSVAENLNKVHAGRAVNFTAAVGLAASADPRLMRVVFENLLDNAWKFTSKTAHPEIRFGADKSGGIAVYFVQDNGVGFDQDRADKLFVPFQRLHTEKEFPGTGIGLATVQRIIGRHGGRVWAESKTGQGTVVRWTLGERGWRGTLEQAKQLAGDLRS